MTTTGADNPRSQRGQRRTRNGKGQFVRDIVDATRDAKAADLIVRGYTYDEAAAELGYSDKAAAWRGVQRVLHETVQPAGEELRKLHDERLRAALKIAWDAMDREHVLVQKGEVIVDKEGKAVRDYMPTLAAMDRVLKILQQYADLHGMNAPKKIEADGSVRYVIEGIDLGRLT